jgi:hypothetical protein
MVDDADAALCAPTAVPASRRAAPSATAMTLDRLDRRRV